MIRAMRRVVEMFLTLHNSSNRIKILYTVSRGGPDNCFPKAIFSMKFKSLTATWYRKTGYTCVLYSILNPSQSVPNGRRIAKWMGKDYR